MNDRILNRIEEINKELNEIKKEEENDMIDNLMNDFLKDIEKVDFDIFDEYLRTTNETDAQIEDLFKQLTPEGIMMVVNTITRIYVYKLKNNDLESLTRKELKNLAYFGLHTSLIEPDNKLLQSILMSLILTFSKKGGE